MASEQPLRRLGMLIRTRCIRYVLPLVLALACAAPASAQFTTENPLDEVAGVVKTALELAGVPFSRAQETEIALFLQDRRNASEELFGEMLDFRGGPPRGEDRDRALSAVQWINEEFQRGRLCRGGSHGLTFRAVGSCLVWSPVAPANEMDGRFASASLKREERHKAGSALFSVADGPL